jgi:hypothetical protein
MREWVGCMLLVFMTAVQPISAFAIAAEPADGPGCLGVTAEVCVQWLRATMTVDEKFLAGAMARRHEVDVNGKPVSGGFVTVYARLPGKLDPFVLLLHLRPDDTVQRVESNLLGSLLDAGTERSYDASGLFEVASRLLGRRCPNLRKIDLYRFFENSVKPRVTRQRQDLSSGINGLHRILWHAAGIPYCGGITLAYNQVLEWRGSKDPEAAAQQTVFSSIELQ